MRRMRAPVLDVPVDGVAGDTELRLDLGAVGRPGPLHGWSLLSDDIAEEGGRTGRTIRLLHHVTDHAVTRVFARDLRAPGETDTLWRRIE